MRLNRLDLNLLIALDALLSERNITRAAERIHLSQPATSGALARLRTYFDDDILVRIGGRMVPTPLGESLREPVHNILLQIQTAVERKPEFDPAQSDRNFRFLTSDYVASTFMARVVRQLAEVAPGVTIEFYPLESDPGSELDRGDVDFLILPVSFLHGTHPVRTLYEEDYVCVGWRDNVDLEAGMSLEAFLALGHVGLRFGSARSLSQEQIYLTEQLGVTRRFEVVAANFNAMPEYLPGTRRVATVFRDLAEKWARYLPLKIVPFPVPLPRVTWGVQWHQYRDRDPGMEWMRNLLVAVATDRETPTVG